MQVGAVISHGRPVRNGIASPGHRKFAVFLKFLDFAIPKAKHHNNDHSNCQGKNWNEASRASQCPYRLGPSNSCLASAKLRSNS